MGRRDDEGAARVLIALALVALALFGARAQAARATMVGYNDDSGRLLGVPRLVDQSNTQVARVGFGWQAIEPAPGQFDWRRVDAVVELLDGDGIRPILNIGGAPDWAGPVDPGLPCECNLIFDQAWQDMWRRLAVRFPEAIINVLNEPNLEAFGDLSAARAAQLTNSAATAIWSVDPGRTVIGPPAGPVAEWREYAASMYSQIDPSVAMGVNLYPHGTLISNVRGDLGTVGRIAAGRPIWITETNVSRSEVGRSRQARYIKKIYSLARKRRIRTVVFHRLWSPYSASDAIFARDAGMSALSLDGRPRHMYDVIRRLHRG